MQAGKFKYIFYLKKHIKLSGLFQVTRLEFFYKSGISGVLCRGVGGRPPLEN